MSASRILALIAYLCGSVVWAGLWAMLGALRCDDSCTGTSWGHDADAWQWAALPLLAALGFLFALGVAVTARSDRSVAKGLVAAHMALFAASLFMIAGSHSIDMTTVVLWAAPVAAAAVFAVSRPGLSEKQR
jgi:hypothetical protein